MTIVTSMRQIVTSINRVSAAIQRYFTQLDPVANAHYELATPITLTGDFDIGIQLLTTDTTNQVILGDIHTDNLYMNMTNGSITLWLNGQHRTFNTTSSLNDGKLHNVLFQLRTNTLECIIDGESLGTLNVTNPVITSANLQIGTSNSVAIYFDGILSDLIITDKSGAEDVTTTFALDSGKGVSVENSLEGNNSATRILVADEDIELFEKSGNQWNNISPLPQELPAVIEIAPQQEPPWILATGAWNDNGVWDDNATWNDGV